jgi:hypothetical protein
MTLTLIPSLKKSKALRNALRAKRTATKSAYTCPPPSRNEQVCGPKISEKLGLKAVVEAA